MNRFLLACALSAGCLHSAESPSEPPLDIIEAPRPNSGVYTTEEAATALAALLPSLPRVPRDHPALVGWRGPSPGFHAHLDIQGVLTTDGVQTDLEGLRQARQEALNLVDSVPVSILLTFEEQPPGDEKLARVVEALFEPAIQLYVLR